MELITIWNMSKRYVTGALVSGMLLALGLIGVDAVQNPEIVDPVTRIAEGLGLTLFYSMTILWKNWRQKKVIDEGGVVPERVESASTAAEHGV